MPPAKTKVAILGGGPAAMACAFKLTETEQLRERFEITVHQPGHRLGGKCASGRDHANGDRILEHGLHIWFGFYDHAFQLMRDCYGALDRPAGTPMATFEDAFEPCGDVVVYERYDDRWIARELPFPRNPLEPGEPDGMPEWPVWPIIEGAVGWLLGRFGLLGLGGLRWGLAEELLQRALGLAGGAGDIGVDIVAGLMDKVNDIAWHMLDDDLDDDDTRFWLQNLDIVTAMLKGIGGDDLLEHGTVSIDHLEFSQWLTEHGIHEHTLRHSPVIRGVYDSSFAYVDGDITRPDMAAGTALRDTMRLLFGYRGALFYKMQAGMGDIVFAPLYAVLRKRGVRFEFFSSVQAIRADATGATITEVDVISQVGVTDGSYSPLYPVKELLCWPHEPLWDQLDDGRRLSEDPPDFEHVTDPLGRGARTLKSGSDFDKVVLAFPPDVQRTVCADLIGTVEGYEEMLGSFKTVTTQAFQLWFDRPLNEGLGWRHGEDSICGSYVEPLDTWCTMSQLIGCEDVENVGAIVYCCGVMPDAGLGDIEQANALAAENTTQWLAQDAATLWPHVGDAELIGSYSRSNMQATERYVLSVARSIEHRRWPGETNLDNLVFAGDWTHSGLDAGCVEASVTSGLLAAQALSGHPEEISGLADWLNVGPPPPV